MLHTDLRFETLLRKVEALTPEFASRAAASDENRAYPHENFRALKELGIAGLGLSSADGGLGLTLREQIQITEQIARGDGSTALALSMHRVSVDMIAGLPDFAYGAEVLENVVKNGDMICSVVSLPTTETDSRKAGVVAKDEGDTWLISGRGGFATNSEGSRYITLACSLADGQGMCIAPVERSRDEVKLLHNWAGMGMRGTASHDVVVENLRIPKAEGYLLAPEKMGVLGGGGGQIAILGVWMGLAQAALDFTVEYLMKRHGFMGGTGFNSLRADMSQTRSDQAWAQIVVGEIDTMIWRAREAVLAYADKYDAGTMDREEMSKNQTRCNHVVHEMGEQVVLAALKVCGAHAYVTGKALERIFRDILAGSVMKEKNDQLAQGLGARILSGAAQPGANQPTILP